MSYIQSSNEVRVVTSRFFHWLAADALPLWSTIGVDRSGGFIEQLTPDGQIIADVRRARVVARQIYAFKSAGSLGWHGPVDDLVCHGLSALLDHHLNDQKQVTPRYIIAENRGEGDFDLYDQAFALFGLAHGYAQSADSRLEQRALAILESMRADWRGPYGGFAEHRPAQAPLKANPHMHLLEAALAWIEVSDDPAWPLLAADVVGLCLTHFVDARTGGLHELFDINWSALAGDADMVEPGHQAEWAWLLFRWQKLHTTDGLAPAAYRLFEIAENEGLDRKQQRLVNELNSDLTKRDCRLRLWPQTERIKALIAVREHGPNGAGQTELDERIAQAVEALLGYFEHPIAGSWWEHFDASGKPVREPARASSLYHIMGAANELARFTGEKLS